MRFVVCGDLSLKAKQRVVTQKFYLEKRGKEAMDVCASSEENFSKLIDTVNSSWSNKSTNEYTATFADACSKIYNDETLRKEYRDCAKLLLSFISTRFNRTMRRNGFSYA